MGIAYTEWDNRTDTIVAGIKQRILASSDWAHLQLTTGTQATTLASGASAAATSISTVATIPSGSYITIGNGAANPEVRLTTAVSGAGPFTVSFNAAEPLVNSYSSGANVGVGSYVKATTVRGAQMVIDLAGTAPDTLAVKPTFYQTHDGTTGGTSVGRFIVFKRLTGAATNILHCRVSAAKDWIYVDVEGPRAGETGADSASNGSYRSPLYMGDIVPAYVSDTVPAVVLACGASGATNENTAVLRVSRNRDNTTSWQNGQLRSLTYPMWGSSTASSGNFNPVTKTGDYIVSPCVIFETGDGLRGTLQYLFHGGIGNVVVDGNDIPGPPQGTEMISGGYKYRALYPFRTDTVAFMMYVFGSTANSGTNNVVSAILWVPVAVYP